MERERYFSRADVVTGVVLWAAMLVAGLWALNVWLLERPFFASWGWVAGAVTLAVGGYYGQRIERIKDMRQALKDG